MGNAASDWEEAVSIHGSLVKRSLFWINQPLIKVEKSLIEPTADWIESADIFRLIARISPALEAIGVLAIPVVLFFATRGYQESVIQRQREYQESIRLQNTERLQQQAIKDYLDQLSALLLNLDGDIRDSQNERLRTLTVATTLTLLQDPEMNSVRKGQVIRFLAEMGLVNSADLPISAQETGQELAPISLSDANLDGARLENINLSHVNLSDAGLEKANLSTANLSTAYLVYAQLSEADLSDANLSNANLAGANLSNSNLSDANLSNANLTRYNLQEDYPLGSIWSYAELQAAYRSGENVGNAFYDDPANMSGANLSGANLHEADLSEVSGLITEQVKEALLCKTLLPEEVDVDSNRDCDALEK